MTFCHRPTERLTVSKLRSLAQQRTCFGHVGLKNHRTSLCSLLRRDGQFGALPSFVSASLDKQRPVWRKGGAICLVVYPELIASLVKSTRRGRWVLTSAPSPCQANQSLFSGLVSLTDFWSLLGRTESDVDVLNKNVMGTGVWSVDTGD
ncbi:hypothetical protein BaRGS_00009409 [Batillaria attramentaria]|uniref:Uncharacterized protein n=1 Tax=Batillaria attramentaria TaxID=370345 RepID=A0ABD0LKF9_9CAEN